MLTLTRLRPGPAGEVAATAAYAHPTGESRYLRVNMVSSIDGAATMEGRVGSLTGPADQELLVLLRSLSDVLLVGAGTVRAEGYGPVRARRELADHRRGLGQLPAPRLAVVSRTIDVDLASPAFTQAPERPIVITTGLADPARVRAAEEVAEVVVGGERAVDLSIAVDRLAGLGLPRILSEGGPHVLAGLFAADLVDELCLAVSPIATCGEGPRITAGPSLPAPLPMRLALVAERDEFLFLRYTRP